MIASATVNKTTRPVTLDLREQFPVKAFGDVTVYANFADMPAGLLVELIEQGALRILNDGNGAKDLTDAERIAKMQKRIDSWMKGQFRIVERGDATVTLMREALRDRVCRAMDVDSIGDAAFAKFQSDSIVAAGMPKPETGKAIKVEDVVAARVKLQNPKAKPEELAAMVETMMAELEAEGRKIADERAKTTAKLDVAGITI